VTIKVTKCLREFLALPEWVDIITPSILHPWNGYMESSKNRFTQFRAGVVWDAVNHMIECSLCRMVNDLYLHELEQWRTDIHNEWIKTTQ